MSGLPNADLAQEQQQPGDPAAFSSFGNEQYGGDMIGSEMPEAPKDKFFRKMREQPLVPIGMCVLLTLSYGRPRELFADDCDMLNLIFAKHAMPPYVMLL